MVYDSRPRFTLLNPTFIDTIIDEALSVLEQLGIFFECPQAEALLKDHGGKKDHTTGHILIPRDLVDDASVHSH